MLDRGTLKQDKFAIAQRLEGVGASISFNVENQTVDIRARCLAKDLSVVVALIAEQLRQPAFKAEEFEKVRQQFIGAVRGSIDNSSYRARDAFNRAFVSDWPSESSLVHRATVAIGAHGDAAAGQGVSSDTLRSGQPDPRVRR